MESFCLKWKQKTSPCTILPRSALILEFRNFFSHLILSLNLVPRILFKNCLFVTSLVEIWILLSILWCHFPRKTFKIEEQKEHKIVWNTKFYHPAKFELKRIKRATVVPRVQGAFIIYLEGGLWWFPYFFLSFFWSPPDNLRGFFLTPPQEMLI